MQTTDVLEKLSRACGPYFEPGHGAHDDDEVRYRVDHESMLALKQYYDRDSDIQACRERKLYETFRHKWSVGLWLKGEKQLMKVKLLNTESYQTLLRVFLAQAHDYLTLFQFCGLYCVRDMARWYEEWEEAQETGQALADPLPFGVVELGINRLDCFGHYDLVRPPGSMRRHLEFQCEVEALRLRYDFFVYDAGARFEPLVYQTVPPGCMASDVQVVSAFTQLRYQRRLVHEAGVCLMDANFMSTHPESYVEVGPMPDQKAAELPEDVRYAMDSLSQASTAQSLSRMKQTTALAGQYRDEMNRASYARNAQRARAMQLDAADATLYNERQTQFGRPNARETLEPLPECMKIARGPAPVSLVDPALLQREYEGEVCTAMHFPYDEMKPHAARQDSKGGGRSASATNPAQQEHAQRQLSDAVVKFETQCQALFGLVYPCSFGHLDRQLVHQELGHPDLQVRLTWDNVMHTTSEQVQALLPFYEAGLLGDQTVWEQIQRAYNLKANKGARLKREPEGEAGKSGATKKKKTSK